MTETTPPQKQTADAPDPAAAPVMPVVGAGTATTGLVLTPPQAVGAIEPEAAQRAVAVDPEQARRIEAMVSGYVDAVVALDPHDPAFTRKVGDVSSLGDREIREYAAASNRLLERPVRSLDRGVLNEKSTVGKGLVDLRHTVEDLNPAKHDLAHGGPRKLLGVIPFGDRVRGYFDKYHDAQSHIDGIIAALRDGKDELVKDNAAIEQERVNLWAQIGRLREYSYMAERLDSTLEARITDVERTDAEKAKILRSDVLFAVRQRHQDLLTQLAVDEQGYLALGLIRQNNAELVKGVDRATTTTIAALRTAVIVAQALTNQRLVLTQIRAVNETTSGMIESTAEMLREQTAKVHEDAASASVDVRRLQAAFDNIFQTLDAIDGYKTQALDTMKVTITELTTQVGKAQAYLERSQSEERPGLPAPEGTLALPAPGPR
ncbi:MAG TPA: toxic anion resistance protein [Candidatus Dormibacteraeota bacterium]|nr:toxic anion resistance protein [Candidatus Dormibacteraeota bacterium]